MSINLNNFVLLKSLKCLSVLGVALAILGLTLKKKGIIKS